MGIDLLSVESFDIIAFHYRISCLVHCTDLSAGRENRVLAGWCDNGQLVADRTIRSAGSLLVAKQRRLIAHGAVGLRLMVRKGVLLGYQHRVSTRQYASLVWLLDIV